MALRINASRSAFASVMRREPTEPEKLLWRHLSNSQLNGLKFRRQTVIGTYICDFCCPRIGLIIEIDGDTHVDEDRDRPRSQDLQEMGYFVIRFTNDDVLRNMDGVVKRILEISGTLPERRYTPTPTPPLEGRG
ncbi:endonuclease domain-containing protein [Chakrabartia godavariana]|nr:endonuclease domain-containing protein [Chakrabartia godavariana]